MKERKIGKVFKHKGVTLKVIKDIGCKWCYFYSEETNKCRLKHPKCISEIREDKQDVIYTRVAILPKYFIIKRDVNNPIWHKYADWLCLKYTKWEHPELWPYLGYDGSFGYCGTNANNEVSEFINDPELITLEFWDECMKLESEKEQKTLNELTKKPFEVPDNLKIDVKPELKSITIDWANQVVVKEYAEEIENGYYIVTHNKLTVIARYTDNDWYLTGVGRAINLPLTIIRKIEL